MSISKTDVKESLKLGGLKVAIKHTGIMCNCGSEILSYNGITLKHCNSCEMDKKNADYQRQINKVSEIAAKTKEERDILNNIDTQNRQKKKAANIESFKNKQYKE